MAACLLDERDPTRVLHSRLEQMQQRTYQARGNIQLLRASSPIHVSDFRSGHLGADESVATAW